MEEETDRVGHGRAARIVFAIAALVLIATSCRPEYSRNRFLGIRRADHPARIVIRFGICQDEAVTSVALRYADPPEEAPHEGVLWRIASEGSRRTRFVVGKTPPGFRETVPFEDPHLPGLFVVVEVATTDKRWPITTKSFRPEELPSVGFATTYGPRMRSEIEAGARDACVPKRQYYA